MSLFTITGGLRGVNVYGRVQYLGLGHFQFLCENHLFQAPSNDDPKGSMVCKVAPLALDLGPQLAWGGPEPPIVPDCASIKACSFTSSYFACTSTILQER